MSFKQNWWDPGEAHAREVVEQKGVKRNLCCGSQTRGCYVPVEAPLPSRGSGLSLPHMVDIQLHRCLWDECFHMFKNIEEHIWNMGIWVLRYWSCSVLVQAVSCLLRCLGLVVLVPGESTFFHPILVQLPVMPCQCGMCKAVGFHPHLLLFSMISFYSEHSKISSYPELLNFYKFNGKMSSKHRAKFWK